jgi:hypothetical protein
VEAEIANAGFRCQDEMIEEFRDLGIEELTKRVIRISNRATRNPQLAILIPET